MKLNKDIRRYAAYVGVVFFGFTMYVLGAFEEMLNPVRISPLSVLGVAIFIGFISVVALCLVIFSEEDEP